jgi:galactose mutarotase-like enzyme
MDGTGAAEKENVVIRAGDCAVTMLPWLGGKISSIQIRGNELLQAPLKAYAPRTKTMNFDAGDASGWDECLPSVAACMVKTTDGMASIPDHGDLWRVEWEKHETGIKAQEVAIQVQRLEFAAPGPAEINVATLRGECFSLPLSLERAAKLEETDKGWILRLEYAISNFGAFKVPWSWAAHPLFRAEPGDRIVLPSSIHTLRLEGSGGGRLGESGAAVSWPVAELSSGGTSDLSKAQGANSGIGDKLFAGPLTAAENWCALERPSTGIRIKVGFDSISTPYLGLWICFGGWPDGVGAKQVCVALEPATAPVDSLAMVGPWSRTLGAGESFSWSMTVAIDRL